MSDACSDIPPIDPPWRMRVVFLVLAAIWISWMMLDRRAFETIPPTAGPEAFAAVLDDTLDAAMREYSITGAAAGAMVEGRWEWRARRGQARSDGQPVTDTTVFNLGSISKPLVVWGVLLLAQRGEIDLDAPVLDYLDRFEPEEGRAAWEAVTARRLLQHAGGVNNHGYGGYGAHEDQPADIVELNADWQPIRLIADPGARRIYSGGGYVLLQMLIEDVTGDSLDVFMRREVLGPLGMESSGFDPGRLVGVADSFSYYGRPIESLRDVALAAAGGYASAADIETFLEAQADGGRLLDARWLDQGFAPSDVNPNFAMSWSRTMTPRGVVYGHAGNNSTWHGRVFIRPDSRDGFYFLTNATAGAQLELDLACAWRSWAEQRVVDAVCAPELALTRQLNSWTIGVGLLVLATGYWLVAGLAVGRRRLAWPPRARGPWRLFGRMAGFALMALLTVFAIWLVYTNSVIWRTETVLIDEIPLDEIERLAPAVIAALAGLALAFWSSPGPRSCRFDG